MAFAIPLLASAAPWLVETISNLFKPQDEDYFDEDYSGVDYYGDDFEEFDY